MPNVQRNVNRAAALGAIREEHIGTGAFAGVLENLIEQDNDSPEMQAVKRTLRECRDKINTLDEEGPSILVDTWMDELEQLYVEAMNACQIYCDKKHPHGTAHKNRKANVENALNTLQQEYRRLTVLREKLYSKAENRQAQQIPFDNLATEAQREAEKTRQRKAEKQRNEQQINNIPFDAFAEIVLNRRGKYGYIKKGRFRFYMDPHSERARKANRSLAERLIQVSQERVAEARKQYGREFTIEQRVILKKSLLKILEIREDEEGCDPLRVEKIQEVLEHVNTASSDVDRILKEDPDKKGIAYCLADRIDSRLSGSFIMDQTSKNRKEYRKLQTRKLKAIMRDAKRMGINQLEVSDQDLENLVNGKLFLIRDEVYRHLQYMYKCASTFGGRQLAPEEFFAQNENCLTVLFAYSIKKAAAKTPICKTVTDNRMRAYCEDCAFGMIGQKELLKMIRQGSVPELEAGADGVRESVYTRLSRVPAWEQRGEAVTIGTRDLERMCNLLCRGRQLQMRILSEKGLDAKQLEELQLCGQEIDRLMRSGGQNMELVASGLDNTRFKEGFRKLSDRMRSNGFSYADLAERLKARLTNKVQVQLPQDLALQADNAPAAQPNNVDDTFLVINPDYQKYCLNPFRGNSRKAGQMFLLGLSPSELIVREEDADAMETLHAVLLSLASGAVRDASIRLAGVDIALHTSTTGNLICSMEGWDINTSVPASVLAGRIEADICKNLSRYGVKRAERILKGGLENMVRGEAAETDQPSRAMMYELLKQRTGLSVDELSAESSKNLAKLCLKALKSEKPMAKSTAWNILILENTDPEQGSEVNDREILEYVQDLEEKAGQRNFENQVTYTEKTSPKKIKERVSWTPEEGAIKNMIADLIYPEDSWDQDLMQSKDRIDQLRHTIYLHASTIAKLIKNKDLINNLGKKLGEEFDFGIEKRLREVVDNVLDSMEDYQKEFLEKSSEEEVTSLVKLLAGGRQDVTEKDFEDLQETKLGNNLMVYASVRDVARQKNILDKCFAAFGNLFQSRREKSLGDVLNEMRQKNDFHKKLQELDDQIREEIVSQQTKLQKKMNKYIKQMFDTDKQEAADPENLTLTEMLQKNLTGQSGQGAFHKKILQGYFANASESEKRNMLASALRNLKPDQLCDNVQMTDEEKKKYEDLQPASFFSGFFKGTGPLMQKVLQGLPTEKAAPEFKEALDDVKSNLHPISPVLVSARLNRLIAQSHGAITKIDIQSSLGAASVGEAFLCTIYGPSIPEKGREVVIKMLRPDARKRMKKDAEFFMKCAEKTDAGMKKTFAGQLRVYESELDFRIEAENIDLGQVYDKNDPSVQSEKRVNLVEQTPDLLLLEKAPGTTVGKYFKKVLSETEKFKAQIAAAKGYEGAAQIVPQFEAFYKDLIKHQKMLLTLAQKWVKEGIFESGFYQGDLHKDNIMIDEETATVIDFGNSTSLTEQQRIEIMHVCFSAYTKNADNFASHFEKLLSPEFKDAYKNNQEQKTQFRTMVESVLNKKGDAGTKIAVVLSEAQKLGMEIPVSINNFSLGQIRLQNTIEECNKMLENLKPLMKDLENKMTDKRYSTNDVFYDIKQIIVSYAKENGPKAGKQWSEEQIKGLKEILQEKIQNHPGILVPSILAILRGDDKNNKAEKSLTDLFARAGMGNEKNPLEVLREQIQRDVIEKQNIEAADLKKLDVCGHNAYKTFLDQLFDAMIWEYKEKEKPINMLKGCSQEEQDDFFEVMSNVINDYSGRTANMLGYLQTALYARQGRQINAQAEQERQREQAAKIVQEANETERLKSVREMFMEMDYPLSKYIQGLVKEKKNSEEIKEYRIKMIEIIENRLLKDLMPEQQTEIKAKLEWFKNEEQQEQLLVDNQKGISRVSDFANMLYKMQEDIGKSERGKQLKIMQVEDDAGSTWDACMIALQASISVLDKQEVVRRDREAIQEEEARNRQEKENREENEDEEPDQEREAGLQDGLRAADVQNGQPVRQDDVTDDMTIKEMRGWVDIKVSDSVLENNRKLREQQLQQLAEDGWLSVELVGEEARLTALQAGAIPAQEAAPADQDSLDFDNLAPSKRNPREALVSWKKAPEPELAGEPEPEPVPQVQPGENVLRGPKEKPSQIEEKQPIVKERLSVDNLEEKRKPNSNYILIQQIPENHQMHANSSNQSGENREINEKKKAEIKKEIL